MIVQMNLSGESIISHTIEIRTYPETDGMVSSEYSYADKTETLFPISQGKTLMKPPYT